MSQENVKLIRGAFAAFDRGDINQIIDLMAGDLVTHRVEPDDAVYHGKDGFFQALAEWTEDFEDWTATPEEFIDAGEGVLVRVHQKARGGRQRRSRGEPLSGSFSLCVEERSPA